ncbi:MAG: hypothetical protein WKF71_19655 [Pyrinomonadaceae bacterium]
MHDWMTERENKLREFLRLTPGLKLFHPAQSRRLRFRRLFPNISKNLTWNGILFRRQMPSKLTRKIIVRGSIQLLE